MTASAAARSINTSCYWILTYSVGTRGISCLSEGHFAIKTYFYSKMPY